jgi:acetolactate synthase-1/2/3 large subunit
MKGSQAIIEALLEQGVTHMFGIPGGVVIPFYDELLNYEDKLHHILVRHEQGGAHMAEGYARSSGKVGVCLGTSGPGSTNLLTGIADAYMDSVPIVALGGQVPTSLIGKDAFQESDLMGMTTPVTKHNFQIRDANNIRKTFKQAFHVASTGRPGPVYVELPKDVQLNEVTKENTDYKLPGYNPKFTVNIEKLKEASKLILNAERPVILAGGGITLSSAHNELTELAMKTFIPVVTTSQAKGAFDEMHPLSLGMGGMHGLKSANYAMQNSDLLIVIGCRLEDRLTGNLERFCPEAKIIHMDVDKSEINKNRNADVAIIADAKTGLIELNKIINKMQFKEKEWVTKIKALRKECDYDLDINQEPIDPRKIIFELKRVLKEEDIVVTGVGEHQMIAAHFLRFRKPNKWFMSGGLGTMGFGLPASIGAKVGAPNVEVFDFDGDGSFAMTLQELATAKENQIKVNSVIMNNGYLGMVRAWNDMFYGGRRSQVQLNKTPDFAKIAEAYGLCGITVERPSEIKEALIRSYKGDETTVLNIHVEQNKSVLPIVPAGAANDEMIGDHVPEGYFKQKL